MAINLGPGLQQLSQAIGGMASTAQAVSTQKANMAMAARQNKYNSAAILADTKLQTATYGWLKDAKTKLATGEMKASDAGDELSQFLHETFSNNSSAWFGDDDLAGMFEAEALEPFIAKMYQEVDSIAIENDTLVAVNNASSAIKTGLESLSMGANPDTVYQVLTDSLAAKRAAQPMSDEVFAQELMKINKLYNTGVATIGIQGLVTSGLSEGKVLSAVDALSSGKETESTKAILASMKGNLDSGTAEEMKKNVIKAFDDMQKSRMDTINSSIYEAVDQGKLFDTTSIDTIIEEVPARHKLELHKAKKTALGNNDDIIYTSVMGVLREGKLFTNDDWATVRQLTDFKKQDEIEQGYLENLARGVLAKTSSLVDARSAIDAFEGPVTGDNKIAAKAAITKEFLDQGNDIAKVSEYLLGNDPIDLSLQGTWFAPQRYEELVEDAVETAPVLDEARFAESKDTYIEEHVEEVATQIAASFDVPSLEQEFKESASMLPKAGVTFNPSTLAREVAEEVVARQVEDAFNLPKLKEEFTFGNTERLPTAPFSMNATDTSETPAVENEVPTGESEEQRVQAPPKDAENQEELPPEAPPTEVTDKAPEAVKTEPYIEGEDIVGRKTDWSSYLDQYFETSEARRAEVKREREQAIEKRQSGSAPVEEPTSYTRPEITRGMSQEQIVGAMSYMIQNGEGRYISEEELELVTNVATRKEIIMMAGDPESGVYDNPLALWYVNTLRGDELITDEQLMNTVRDFVKAGMLTSDTVEQEHLTNKHSYATNSNSTTLKTEIGNIVKGIYPGSLDGTKRAYLTTQISTAADRAIAMNPDMMGKDFPSLLLQLQNFAANDSAKGIITDLEKISKWAVEGDIEKLVGRLGHSDMKVFLEDVQRGGYDLVIDYEIAQRPNVRLKRHDSLESVQDVITKEMYPQFKNFADLKKGGTKFEQARVAATASFLHTGGMLENLLAGSFGIQASDMKVVGRQWAFADPANKDVYFIATDTDVKNRGTLGWGIFAGESDGVQGIIQFEDYVDPTLQHDITLQQRRVDDIASKAPKPKAPGSLGIGMLYEYAEGSLTNEDLENWDEMVLQREKDILKKKQDEMDTLVHDIMVYRSYLLGRPVLSDRTRL